MGQHCTTGTSFLALRPEIIELWLLLSRSCDNVSSIATSSALLTDAHYRLGDAPATEFKKYFRDVFEQIPNTNVDVGKSNINLRGGKSSCHPH